MSMGWDEGPQVCTYWTMIRGHHVNAAGNSTRKGTWRKVVCVVTVVERERDPSTSLS